MPFVGYVFRGTAECVVQDTRHFTRAKQKSQQKNESDYNNLTEKK
jgi:hypothetical protein